MKASSLPLIKTTRRTETQTQTPLSLPLSLPLSFSSTKRANSSHLINDFKVMKFKNTNIHKSLLKKLEKARKTIIEDNDIFIDKEHKLLCMYYDKINEIKKQLLIETKTIDISYKQNLIQTNEFENFINKRKNNENHLDFIDIDYKYKIKYNNYNHKFINKIQDNINKELLQSFLDKQNDFLESLNLREIYVLKYYTYHGDIYLNSYIDGTFKPSLIKEIGDGIVDSDTDVCYFFYQFLDYFSVHNSYNDIEVPIYDDIKFINFLKENYLNFDNDIYTFVFDLYLRELQELFKKAPRTTEKMVLYRGIDTNYILNKSERGYYKTSHFTSTSLFAEKAFAYTKIKNRIMLKIIVDENLPLIFVEGITLAKGDFEVIIPLNSVLYIDYALKKVNYYKNSNEIICPNMDTTSIVNLTTVIYSHYE